MQVYLFAFSLHLVDMFSHLSQDERGRYTPVPGLRGRNILEIVEAMEAEPGRSVGFQYEEGNSFEEQSSEFHGNVNI